MKPRKQAKQAPGDAFADREILRVLYTLRKNPIALFPVIPYKRGRFPGVNIDAVHKGRK